MSTKIVAEPLAFHFADDGAVPNNRLPMLVYKGAFTGRDIAGAIETTFGKNDWGHGLWHNGIYPFVHYHAQIHEVLGIAAGKARVRFGGDKGEVLEVEAGDVAVLPAGTGHQRLSSTPDLLVIGVIPAGRPLRPVPRHDRRTRARGRNDPARAAACDRSAVRRERAADEAVALSYDADAVRCEASASAGGVACKSCFRSRPALTNGSHSTLSTPSCSWLSAPRPNSSASRLDGM